MGLRLTASIRRAFDRLASDLGRVLGSRFVALVASSETASVAFATRFTAADLAALGPLVDTWHHDGLETPLLLTPDELRRSLDVFPLEYQGLIDRHIVIAGTPPFGGLTVHHVYLRQACETEAKGHLIHLRQLWLDTAGHDDRLADAIVASAAPLRTLLANVARLNGTTPADPDDGALEGARIAGLDVDLVRGILALESSPAPATEIGARMPAYLAAAESLWAYVDQWQRP